MSDRFLPECLNCEELTHNVTSKYCSNKCQADYRYIQYIKKWVNGELIGLQGHGVVSKHVKRYLREKFDNKCCLCGWAQVNVITGQVPCLICPNCDSMAATYAGLNKGSGRKQRRVSKRVREGRFFVASVPK